MFFYYCFSFDVRGRSFNKALQWSDPGAFGPRAYFATVARPAALTLSSVQLDDEGVYRCRVDFKNSPTRNFQIKLTVIGKFFFEVKYFISFITNIKKRFQITLEIIIPIIYIRI